MDRKQWIAFLGLSLVWGSSFLFIKIALEEVGPFTLAGTRVLIGAIALTITAVMTKAKWDLSREQYINLIVIGFANTALPFFLISWGEILVDSSVASILNGTVPLFVAILAYFWLRDEQLSSNKLVGMLIGFIGVVLVMARDGLAGFQFNIQSQLAILLAAVSYAFSSVYIRKKTPGIPFVVQAAGSLIFANFFLWIGAFLFERPISIPVQSQTWIALVWLGLAGSYIAYLLYFFLLNSAGPSRSVMVTYIMPVVGVVLGVLILGERLDLQLILGTILVISSVVVVNR
jgi:drug/metabolite transporter (DMT)-like permease